jgi:hypothetical protein
LGHAADVHLQDLAGVAEKLVQVQDAVGARGSRQGTAVTMATPADEDQQNKRARTIAQLRALESECLAMADEARATIALLDSIKLP